MKRNFKKRASALILSGIMLSSMTITSSFAENVKGDLNNDGLFNVSDAVILQNWLLGKGEKLSDWKNADLCNDNKLDVFDYIMLRKMLVEKPVDSAYSGLVINEVCTSNKKSLKDSTGASPDWIEIYNSGSSDINLSGVGLSDGKNNRYKFVFPDGCIIKSGAYIVVFCDDTNVTDGTEYHAQFKLSSTGETIYITAPQNADGTAGSDIDIVKVPELPTDITYGRFENGSANFTTLNPSPLAENTSVYSLVSKPVFSVDGGFYDSEFKLSLTSENDSEIIYTLDGSDPRTSETAQTYTTDIAIYDNTSEPNKLSAVTDISLYGYNPPNYNIDKGIVVRAVCKNKNGEYSEVATNNYFVNKTAAYYKDLKVLSISTDSSNFFDDDKGIYMVGSKYYEWKKNNFFSFINPGDCQNPTNYNAQGREWERPCNIQVFENGKLKYTEDVGVRISGNWTTACPQKSLTFYARSEYGSSKMHYDFFEGNARDMNGNKIKEYKKVTIRNGGNDNDNTRFRDDLNQALAKGLDLSTQSKYDYVVFLDGEFWGYYSMQEKIDDNYIESHYNIDADNVTTIKLGELSEGSEASFNEYKQFWEWAKTADMSKPENYQRVCETFDIQSYMDFVAFQSYIANWDCLWNVNNWCIWRSDVIDAENPYADGKWRFFLYDTEYSMGLDQNADYRTDYFSHIDNSWKITSIGSLWHSLMKNESFKADFFDTFTRVATEHLAPEKALPLFEQYSERLSPVINDTFRRFNFNKDLNSNLQKLREAIENRQKYALHHLNKLYGIKDDFVGEETPPTPGGWNPWF